MGTSPDEAANVTLPISDQVTQESSAATMAGEEVLKGGSSLPGRTPSADGVGSQTSPSRAGGPVEAEQESLAVAGGPLTPPPSTPSANRVEPQATAAPSGTPPAGGGGSHAALTAAQGAGALSCELSALGGKSIDNCTVGWLGGKRFVSSTQGDFAPSDASLSVSATAGLPPSGGDGGHGGSAVNNAPVPPAPGPAPSGASGAAVGGSSGLAPSAFLTLAGLLLLAGPRAMRRLRLSCRPWLTACFVLIPERPG